MEYYCLYEHFNENINALILDKQLTSIMVSAEIRNLPMYLYSMQLKKIIETDVELFLKEKQIVFLPKNNENIFEKHVIKNFQIANESSRKPNVIINQIERISNSISNKKYIKKEVAVKGEIFHYYVYGQKKDKNDNPIIFTVFTAYLISHQIWDALFQHMPENCIFYVLDTMLPTSDIYLMIKLIYQMEDIKNTIALCWCSGFKSLLKTINDIPDAFQKIISITGNYSDASNVLSFSDYEKSLNTIASIFLDNDAEVVDSFFSKMINKFFLRSDQRDFWNIDQSIYKMVTNPFTCNKLLLPYMKRTMEYKNINVKEVINKMSVPLLNIIAVNDIVSLFDNNTILDDYCGQAVHIAIPFASHWCIWTHAKQVSQLIKAFLKGEA